MKKVLVTGANGFLGRRLVEQLLERGHAVRAFVLPGEDVPAHWSGRIDIVRGDLTEASTVASAVAGMDAIAHLAALRGNPYVAPFSVAGMDAIAHLAALVGDGHRRADQERVTVGGTRHVVEAARRQGGQVILASSICVYGERLRRGACPEDTPFGRPQGTYGWAKQRQEEVLRTLDPAAWTIVRPANIYGPGCKPWLEEAGAALRRGQPVLIGDGHGNAGLTYVDNVAELFVQCLEKPEARGEVFNACDELPVTWAQYFGDLARLLGTAPPRASPRAATQAAAMVLPPLWRLLRLKGRPPVTREAYNLVAADSRIPAAKARKILGWQPRVTYEQALKRIKDSLTSG